MKRHHILWLAAIALAPRAPSQEPMVAAAEASSWYFRPSRYSHVPGTGERELVEYQPEEPSLAPQDPTYQQSGFRDHPRLARKTARARTTCTWCRRGGKGERIRPYGEWEYPFRAGATPFGPWGNPQGPWTLPFDSWQNPFALGRMWGGQGFMNGAGPNGQGPGRNGPGAASRSSTQAGNRTPAGRCKARVVRAGRCKVRAAVKEGQAPVPGGQGGQPTCRLLPRRDREPAKARRVGIATRGGTLWWAMPTLHEGNETLVVGDAHPT